MRKHYQMHMNYLKWELKIKQNLNNDAFDKAQSQMYNLKQDIVRQKEEIRVGGDGTLPVELLKTCLKSSEKQLAIWEYINEGWYTLSGNGLASYFTLDFAYPDKDVQLWLIHDMFYGDMYLVAYVDGYILNRSDGKVCKYEEHKKDLHIMEKFDKMKIVSTLKDRK